jgi:hypothetical protein
MKFTALSLGAGPRRMQPVFPALCYHSLTGLRLGKTAGEPRTRGI